MSSPVSTAASAPSLLVQAQDWFAPLDWSALFEKSQPVEIDLGAGDGGFIAQRAMHHPGTNFLAVERLLGRARKIDRKGRARRLSNLRVLRMDILYAVKCLCRPASVSAFYLLFPDPWPKKKHQRRRMIRGEFLAAIERALLPGGRFFAATDHAEYFSEIAGAFQTRPGWIARQTADSEWFPEKTDFERQYLDQNKPIGRLQAVWSGRPQREQEPSNLEIDS